MESPTRSLRSESRTIAYSIARSPSTTFYNDSDAAASDKFVADLSEQLAAALRSKASLHLQLKASEAENAELREVIEDTSEKQLEKKNKSALKTASIRALEKELKAAQAQFQLGDQRIQELETELDGIRTERDELREDLTKARQSAEEIWSSSNLEHQLHDSNLEVLELQGKIDQLSSKLAQAEQQNEDLESQVNISGGQLQQLQQEVAALKETLLHSKLEGERKSAEKDKQIAQLQEMVNQQQTGMLLTGSQNPPGPNACTACMSRPTDPSQQAQTTQQNSLTIVIPPRPSVPFEESFRISVTLSRREAFRQNPLFIDQCHALPENATFTRGYLMDKLGGASQGVVARVANKKSLSEVHDVGLGVLYPQPALNSWLPAMPGAHGYMFVGLKGPGKDHVRFLQPTKWSLFLPKGGKIWEYYGEYEVYRQPDLDLTVEEWEAFSPEFRKGYSECTIKKESPHAELTADIIQATQDKYDKGQLKVPCTALKCVGYNRQLVLDLLSPHLSQPLASPSKRIATEAPEATPKPKRKKARTNTSKRATA
ncbi:hypothetical protein QCA50_002051 [Cerrena zonata]|uniref:DUF6697 domain-containing protein n=1 Tax=Cerrena zonata TaxID=2478898 RepID=A0AAW0GW78_9APHY